MNEPNSLDSFAAKENRDAENDTFRTEIAQLKAERDAFKIEYESRAAWIAKMNAILGYDNADGFHSRPDPHELAQALKAERDELREALQQIMDARSRTATDVNNAIERARRVLARTELK